MKRRPKDSYLDEQDEHNQPTEPMPIVAAPFPPAVSPGDSEQIPVPQPPIQLFPQRTRGNTIFPGATAGVPVYPYLPPAPIVKDSGRPAGGATPLTPTEKLTPYQAARRWRPLPILVGLFFVAVQLLLFARFVLKIIHWPASTTWVGTIYAVSEVFLFPFRLLLQNVAFPLVLFGSVELSTLLAVCAYWLLSRILVRLLKAILRS